ncbi:MAG TPA: addiction module protein [Burkholderiaceae bacterium]|jgi:hypothetical protein
MSNDGTESSIGKRASTEASVPGLDALWESEIERRLAAYERGEVHAVDADEVFAKARRLARSPQSGA